MEFGITNQQSVIELRKHLKNTYMYDELSKLCLENIYYQELA